MKGTEYFVSLKISVVTSEENCVMFDNEEIIGTTEYVRL
jgi:hypothetical protein